MGRPARAAVAAAGAGLALVVTTLGAQPAAAHTIGGVAATNYRSAITGLDPPVPGIHLRLLDLGRRIELVNRTSRDVVVLGYFGEPYLRVGPGGVFQNRRSPATYQNKLVPAGATTTTLPAVADPNAPPLWDRQSGGRTVKWRDRRTRWEGSDPPLVRQDSGSSHVVVPVWTIDLRWGDTSVRVIGQISWIPGPAVGAWVLVAFGLAALPLVAARSRRWGVLLSALTAALVATDVVRSFAAAAVSGDAVVVQMAKVLVGGLLLTGAWVLGAWAVGALQDRRQAGLAAAGMAGLVIAVYGGVGDASTLARSQVPSVFPAVVARAAVAAALGLGVGLVGAGLLVDRRLRRTVPR